MARLLSMGSEYIGLWLHCMSSASYCYYSGQRLCRDVLDHRIGCYGTSGKRSVGRRRLRLSCRQHISRPTNSNIDERSSRSVIKGPLKSHRKFAAGTLLELLFAGRQFCYLLRSVRWLSISFVIACGAIYSCLRIHHHLRAKCLSNDFIPRPAHYFVHVKCL